MEREVPLDIDRMPISKTLWGYNKWQVHEIIRLLQDKIQVYRSRIEELESGGATHPASGFPSFFGTSSQVAPTPAPAATPAISFAPVEVAPVPVAEPVLQVPVAQSPAPDQVETNLRGIFEMAQRTADEMTAKALADADLVKRKAQAEADRMMHEAQANVDEQTKEGRNELAQLKWDIERLRLDKDKLVEDYKSFLEGRLKSLGTSAKSFLTTAPKGNIEPLVTPEEERALLADDLSA